MPCKGAARRLAAGALLLLLGLIPPLAQAQSGPPSGLAPISSASPDTRYQLGAGDKLRVTVFGAPALSGEFAVSDAGTISMPLVGEIAAAQRSQSQLQETIATVLRGDYVKEPRVSVEVITYRPFYILGEVNKPGEYPYVHGQTAMNAVARAAGFTTRANTTAYLLKRQGSTSFESMPLSVDAPIGPGDTIRIQESMLRRFLSITAGAVRLFGGPL